MIRSLVFIFGTGITFYACGPSTDNLVPKSHISGDTIPRPLSGFTGALAEGQRIFAERESGHCVICHSVASLDIPFQGTVGPDLSNIGARLSKGQLRLRIVDMSMIMPDTIMPPYYRITDLHQVAREYEGEPVLSSEEIEHLVAYLSSLNSGDGA